MYCVEPHQYASLQSALVHQLTAAHALQAHRSCTLVYHVKPEQRYKTLRRRRLYHPETKKTNKKLKS